MEANLIGQRIRLERERLSLNQSALGVAQKTQWLYESGQRFPDAAYLAQFAALGADVRYILTGQRESAALSPEETALLDNYRNAGEFGQRIIRGTAATAAQPELSEAAA